MAGRHLCELSKIPPIAQLVGVRQGAAQKEAQAKSGRAWRFRFRGTPQCPMSITENDLGEGHRPLIAILDKVFTHQLNFGDPQLSVNALLGGRPLNCAEGALPECIRRFRLGLRESLLQAGLYGLLWHQALPFSKHSLAHQATCNPPCNTIYAFITLPVPHCGESFVRH